jgi:hypothetical protein
LVLLTSSPLGDFPHRAAPDGFIRFSFVRFTIFMVQEGPTRFIIKGMKGSRGVYLQYPEGERTI